MSVREDRYILLRARKLITCSDIGVIDHPNILIKGDKILDVGKEGEVTVPRNAEIIDLEGQTLLPGLVDAHVHLSGRRSYNPSEYFVVPHDLKVIRAVDDCKKLLLSGFTTVRDMGSRIALSLKRGINEGTIIGPRIIAAGRPISQTGGHGDIHYLPREEVLRRGFLLADGVDDCRRAVREAIRDGSDVIKIMTTGGVGSEKDAPWYPQFTIDEVKVIVEEAHRVGRRVASHAQGAEGIKIAILGGVDSIEHGYFLDDEVIKLMLDYNVYYVPTLCLVEVYKKSLERGYDMPRWRLEKQKMCIDAMPKSFLEAYRAGVKIAAGTDYFGAPMRRHGDNADEVITMVKYGMDVMDAIYAGTRNAAECLGLNNLIGSIEPGKKADIIGLGGDPLKDINELKKVMFVMKDGVIYKNSIVIN